MFSNKSNLNCYKIDGKKISLQMPYITGSDRSEFISENLKNIKSFLQQKFNQGQ